MVKSKEYEKARKQRLTEGRKLISEKVKLEKAKLTSKKFEERREEKKSKKIGKLLKSLSKPVTSKRIMKKGQMTIHIPERKVESIFNDPNRFFKNEWEETKKSMFL